MEPKVQQQQYQHDHYQQPSKKVAAQRTRRMSHSLPGVGQGQELMTRMLMPHRLMPHASTVTSVDAVRRRRQTFEELMDVFKLETRELEPILHEPATDRTADSQASTDGRADVPQVSD